MLTVIPHDLTYRIRAVSCPPSGLWAIPHHYPTAARRTLPPANNPAPERQHRKFPCLISCRVSSFYWPGRIDIWAEHEEAHSFWTTPRGKRLVLRARAPHFKINIFIPNAIINNANMVYPGVGMNTLLLVPMWQCQRPIPVTMSCRRTFPCLSSRKGRPSCSLFPSVFPFLAERKFDWS